MSDDENQFDSSGPKFAIIPGIFNDENSLTDIMFVDYGTQNIRAILKNQKGNTDTPISATVIFDSEKIQTGAREASTSKFNQSNVFFYPKLYTGVPFDELEGGEEEDAESDDEKGEVKPF